MNKQHSISRKWKTIFFHKQRFWWDKWQTFTFKEWRMNEQINFILKVWRIWHAGPFDTLPIISELLVYHTASFLLCTLLGTLCSHLHERVPFWKQAHFSQPSLTEPPKLKVKGLHMSHIFPSTFFLHIHWPPICNRII